MNPRLSSDVGNGERMKHLAILLIALSCGLTCKAHTDTVITLDGDKLIGLPNQYSPAVFNWKSRTLRIGANQVDLSAFENVVPLNQEYAISIASSWYHKRSTLPPYIGLKLKPKGRTFTYSLLFNLETLEVIKVSLDYRIHKEDFIQCVTHEIKLSAHDKKQIKQRTKQVK